MCEHYVARASEPFRLDELWSFTDRLERYGIAGFGWGAAWLTGDGKLASYRDLRAFGDDPGREAVGATETTAALVHLRRPSKLSTIGMADTQPFDDPAGRFAFSHNGDLRDIRTWRARYRGEGRIHGQAGCNRFSGAYREANRTLTPGPMIATRMACPEPRMRHERDVLHLLSGPVGFFYPDGDTLLLTRNGGTLRLRRL